MKPQPTPRGFFRSSGQHALIVATGSVLTGVFLAYLPKPYIYIFALWTIACVYGAAIAAKPLAKILWLNLVAVFFAFGCAEIYFYEVYFSEEPPRETEFAASDLIPGNTDIIDLFGKHDVLGWAPTKGRTFFETTRFANTLIYKVRYTIDKHGLRVAPPFVAAPDEQARCLLFFGDSFTFGEGVRDQETMPYRVGQKSHGRYQVYNFGFLGYGPHQMLAQLQEGLVDTAIHCKPAYTIYQALPDHVSRAAGLEAWDQFGPKFVRTDNGSVVQRGHFEDEKKGGFLAGLRRFHYSLPNEAKHYLEKSALYKGLLYLHRPVNDHDIDLCLRIVDQSRHTLEARYEGVQFHVLFWDFSGEDPTETKLIQGLRAQNIKVHLISDILPEYRDHENRFEIHPADGHPNKLAYELLADYILRAIVKDSDHGGQSDTTVPEVKNSITR